MVPKIVNLARDALLVFLQFDDVLHRADLLVVDILTSSECKEGQKLVYVERDICSF